MLHCIILNCLVDLLYKYVKVPEINDKLEEIVRFGVVYPQSVRSVPGNTS